MIKANEGVEPDTVADDRQIFDQQAVSERQQRIHRISRRTAVAPRELERELRVTGAILSLQHAFEMGEVNPGRVSFDSQQLVKLLGLQRDVGITLELAQGDQRRLQMIAAQQRTLITDLRGHQLPRHAQAEKGLLGETKLPLAQEYIL